MKIYSFSANFNIQNNLVMEVSLELLRQGDCINAQ